MFVQVVQRQPEIDGDAGVGRRVGSSAVRKTIVTEDNVTRHRAQLVRRVQSYVGLSFVHGARTPPAEMPLHLVMRTRPDGQISGIVCRDGGEKDADKERESLQAFT